MDSDKGVILAIVVVLIVNVVLFPLFTTPEDKCKEKGGVWIGNQNNLFGYKYLDSQQGACVTVISDDAFKELYSVDEIPKSNRCEIKTAAYCREYCSALGACYETTSFRECYCANVMELSIGKRCPADLNWAEVADSYLGLLQKEKNKLENLDDYACVRWGDMNCDGCEPIPNAIDVCGCFAPCLEMGDNPKIPEQQQHIDEIVGEVCRLFWRAEDYSEEKEKLANEVLGCKQGIYCRDERFADVCEEGFIEYPKFTIVGINDKWAED